VGGLCRTGGGGWLMRPRLPGAPVQSEQRESVNGQQGLVGVALYLFFGEEWRLLGCHLR